MLICHDRKHKSKEYAVITNEGKQYNFLSESIKIAQCNHCNTLLVLHIYETYEGETIKKLYRGKKAKRFIHKIIQKHKTYKSKQIDHRPYLLYNEYGNENKKCYSNLSGMKLGKEDTYQGLSKKHNAA